MGQEAAVVSSTKEGFLLTYHYLQFFLQVKSKWPSLPKCSGKQAFKLELETLNYIVIVFFFSFKYNFKYFKHILNYLEV